jgi:diguanylate cyclase (GGDEF)-like protein
MSGRGPGGRTVPAIRSSELLAALESYARQASQTLFLHLLDESEIALVDTAFLGGAAHRRLQALEAVAVLRRIRRDPPDLCGDDCFRGQPAEPAPGHEAQPLALVGFDELEVQLALRKAMRRGAEQGDSSQFALRRRLAQLLDAEPDASTFPLGVPAQLQRLCRELLAAGLPVALLPLLLQLAGGTLVDGLIQLCDELNERLRRAGVLPDLEIEQWPELRRLHERVASAVEAAPEAPTPAVAEAESVDGPAAVISPAAYRASRQLLQLLHGTAAERPDAVLLQPQAVVDALAALAGQGVAVSQPLRERIENWLATQGVEARLPERSATQIELSERVVEMLARLLSDLPELRELVRRLEIPLAAAALADETLFEHPEHPAHQLVNTVGELSRFRSQIDGALGARIADILTPITRAVPCSASQLGEASRALGALGERQTRAREKSIQRLVEACEGQQRLLQANLAVDRELHRRLAHIEVPRPLLQLVENGWRELLRLVWLRDGAAAEAWREALALLDELLWQFSRLAQGVVIEAADIAALGERLRRVLERAFPADFRRDELVTSICAVLARDKPLQLERGSFAFALRPARVKGQLRSELEHAYPELAPWLRRLRDYRVGDQFAYVDERDAVRHTLVWISNDHQNFVFVDDAGARSLDLDIVDFARELSRGLAPVGDSMQQPLVARAMADTARQAFEAIVDRQSVDELTGLLNRRSFEEKVQSAVLRARSQQQRYTLLYIDVDRFAVVNQLFGHVAGDELLRQIGITLAAVAGGDAELARLVGNEFAVLLPLDGSRAQRLAERMRERVASTVYRLAAGNADVTLSIGAVEIDKFAANATVALRDAQFACSEAKAHGRDQLQLFEGGAEVIARRDRMLHWINKMGELLDEEALSLRMQPIVAVADRTRISHYEVLLGLRGDDGEVGSPIEFIEAAERYGSMRRVDRWVIDRALGWLAQTIRQGLEPPSLAINLSANSLNDPALADFLFERFGAHAVSPKLVCFEITETATIDNLISTADFIRRVKRLGCAFALDDFGTGRCSYEYLKQLPVDYLKIDGAFIESINDSTEDLLIVRSINEIAHAMGIHTIAEYVSSEPVLARLREVGVDFAQGYAISRPMAMESVNVAASVH